MDTSKSWRKRTDCVFDSYSEKSVKSSKHIRKSKSDYILYHKIEDNTKIPKQEVKFWGSSENKIKLQLFIQDYIKRKASSLYIVFSTVNNNPCISTHNQVS